MAITVFRGSELRATREQLGLSQAKLAEVARIPRAALSAFELGKAELPDGDILRLKEVLSQGVAVRAAISRKKRYQQHEFARPRHDPSRVGLAMRTPGNTSYLEQLSKLDEGRGNVPADAPTAISLFSGCGGFSTGFAWAGFNILGFVEIESAFRRIYQENFPWARELSQDITRWTDAEIDGWHRRSGNIDVVIGGPPCQGFSLSGKRRSDDSRNVLFEDYLRVVGRIRPKVAILENVRLLTSMRFPDQSLVADAIRAGFLAKGYEISSFEVNAKDYGVPQHRERVVFVAVRKDLGLLPSVPTPTHGNEDDLFNLRAPHRSFADACSDLDFLESGEESSSDALHETVHHPKHVIDWLWDVPQGSSAHDNPDPGMRPPSGYNTTYKRQVWLEPAATVQTTFGMISGCRNVHPIATRSLTVREAARIQSYPDGFKFPGPLGAIRTSIGNSVPPLLAFALGNHVKRKMLDLVKVTGL